MVRTPTIAATPLFALLVALPLGLPVNPQPASKPAPPAEGSKAQTAAPKTRKPSRPAKKQEGTKAIPDPVEIDAAGYAELLARHRGQPVMVNFWATWCEPCRDEYPMVNELARQYAPQGLVVLGVSLDEDVEINLVRHFLTRTNPVFPNYRKKPGADEPFINGVSSKWTGAIPATFFYNRDGRQVTRLVGEHKRPAFEKAIQDLLRAPVSK